MTSTFFTVKEVAETLKVSVSTVRRAIKASQLRAIRVGGQLRVTEKDLDRYTATGEPQNAADDLPSEESSVIRQTDGGSASRSPTTGVSYSGRTNSGLDWRIINADVNAGLGMLNEDSVNCIVTSPPYYWQRDYEVEGQIGHEDTIAGYVESLVSAFREARRVLMNDGVLLLNLGDTYYSAKGRPHGRDPKHNGRQMARRTLRAVDGPGLGLPRKSLIGIPWRVALALQEDGWTLRSDIIWQRPGSLPEPTATDRPWRTFEHVFLFTKGPRYWFNRNALNGDEDIWRIVARPENPGSHFAPYPRELVERCVMSGCPRGGTVLDPFVGSGTTMVVALESGSSAIGIDLKQEYCLLAQERIERESSRSRKVKLIKKARTTP